MQNQLLDLNVNRICFLEFCFVMIPGQVTFILH